MARQLAGAVIALALPGLVRLGLVLVQWQGAGKPAGTRPVAAAIRDARVRSTAASDCSPATLGERPDQKPTMSQRPPDRCEGPVTGLRGTTLILIKHRSSAVL